MKQKDMLSCAACTVRACLEERPQKLPAGCPMRDTAVMAAAMEVYRQPETRRFHIIYSQIEKLGYSAWVRLREIMEFSRRMDYERLGLAFCKGLSREAAATHKILRANGFRVSSVICKAGGVAKEEMGIAKEYKLRPEDFEPMCNPVAQALLLNREGTPRNIVLGLCVGHDSLFYRHAEAMTTTLVTKDRVLAHNPAGALYCAEGYFREKLQAGEPPAGG